MKRLFYLILVLSLLFSLVACMDANQSDTPSDQPPSDNPGDQPPSDNPGDQPPSDDLGDQPPSNNPDDQPPSEEGLTPSQAHTLLVTYLTDNFNGYYAPDYLDKETLTKGVNKFHHATHKEAKNGDFNMKLTLAEIDGTLYCLVDGALEENPNERILVLFTIPADFEQNGVTSYVSKEAYPEYWAKVKGTSVTLNDYSVWRTIGRGAGAQHIDPAERASYLCELALPAIEAFMQEINPELNLAMFGLTLE